MFIDKVKIYVKAGDGGNVFKRQLAREIFSDVIKRGAQALRDAVSRL